ncbi:MAG: glycoside hydrolase family 15 protein [Acidobacteria bacterium]|nr:glycoside hydrolase family 15 protein [Acidobacteriota bacterium]
MRHQKARCNLCLSVPVCHTILYLHPREWITKYPLVHTERRLLEDTLPERFAKKKRVPLHAARIEDYAVIGDCETAALVSRDGSMDWLCWPNFASPACFAALLGAAENGYWQIRPSSKIIETRRRYEPGTMIVETTFVTKDGEVCLVDFMPPRGKHSDVVRIARGVRGKVKMHMDLVLRFDYGLTVPWVTKEKEEIRAIAGPNMVVLRSQCMRGKPAELAGEEMKTVSDFILREDDQVCFTLTYAGSTEELPAAIQVEQALQDTRDYWCEWTARSSYKGPYGETVQRSLMTLKALTYRPTGGVVAAVTAGLPEGIGGERNWDYRYCWLRDTSFTLMVLIAAGYTTEAVRWRAWLLRAIAGSPTQIQSLYGIQGERTLVEWNADWLAGYEHSLPVRIGNAASKQFQLDVYGEVSVALNHMPDAQDDSRAPAIELEAKLIDHLCDIWQMPDEGIWETRGGAKHFVYSKVMAWVALDQAVKRHEAFDGTGNVKLWRKNRDMLHKQICAKGFSKRLNSFTQSYGSKNLDASCLRLLLVGFLPADDPRMIGTVEAIQKHLTKDGLVQRYDTAKSSDGLKGDEGTFLACSFWMVSCLWLIGRRAQAVEMFDKLLGLCNDVGLLSEEYDPKAKRMLGNFPQALSHIALLHAAFTLSATDMK